MTAPEFTLFDTAIGRCGIVWGERGVLGFLLPEGREERTRARLLKRTPECEQTTPPAIMQRAIDDVVALLRGQPRDLSDIVLDMDGVPPFHQRVYAVARTIPPGATLTYGEIATQLGDQRRCARRGTGAGPQSVPDHRAVSPRACRRRQGRRVLRERRHHHEAPTADHRRRAPQAARSRSMAMARTVSIRRLRRPSEARPIRRSRAPSIASASTIWS